MRFKARLASAHQLHRVVTTLSKLGKACLVHLEPHHVAFVVVPDGGGEGVMVWAELSQAGACFLEYAVESRADNRISFFVQLVSFLLELDPEPSPAITSHHPRRKHPGSRLCVDRTISIAH